MLARGPVLVAVGCRATGSEDAEVDGQKNVGSGPVLVAVGCRATGSEDAEGGWPWEKVEHHGGSHGIAKGITASRKPWFSAQFQWQWTAEPLAVIM